MQETPFIGSRPVLVKPFLKGITTAFGVLRLIRVVRAVATFRVAHASRALVSASRRNKLFEPFPTRFWIYAREKISRWRGRPRQHARRVRYPITRAQLFTSH